MKTVAVTPEAQVKLEPEIPQLPLLEVNVKPEPFLVINTSQTKFVKVKLTRRCGRVRSASATSVPGTGADQTAICAATGNSVEITFAREATGARRSSGGRCLGSSTGGCGCSGGASLRKIFDTR